MYRWEFEQDGRDITLDVPGRLTLDDAGLMLEAVLAGTGLAYMAEWWISESVGEGKLRRVLDRLYSNIARALPLLSKPPISARRTACPDLVH